MKQTTAIWGLRPWIFFLFTLSTLFSFSQTPIRCYTDEMDALLRANTPELNSQQDFEDWINNEIQNNAGSKIIGGVYQIPVVFHVIHNGEAVGTATNVSQAAIQSQVDVLNEDFRKMLGTNGWNTHPDGADTKIEFCLAQRRPDGSAFTEPGINRINRSTAGFTAPPFSTAYIDATIKPWTYNGGVPTATRGWDPNKYMNIWLCNISGGILGYAQFPQTSLGGMGCGTPATATDGVVFLYNSIGKSAVTGFGGVYNEGRTATHEIGHWLGLRHIWGDGGCTVDDFCNDTPLAGAANYGCPAGMNSCTAAPDAGVDMIENYMDYTDDLCMNIFTNDQKMRMRTVLESSPLRMNLITSDACIPPNSNDASVVDIVNPKGDNCAGSIIPTVVLRNRGSNNLTSATVSYTIDNGTATTFAWSGTLTPGSSVNVTLPAFTATLGTHNFKSYSTLPNGLVDPSTIYDTSSIDFVVSNGEMAPFTENFDGSVFPPDIRWVVDNPNSDCYRWLGASATSITGVLSNNAAQMPSFQNSTTQTENLITPIFILPCNATAANIQFDVAYRRRNNTTANYERLYIEISENCGATWNATPIYDKTGTVLQVITTTLTSYYTPTGISDWRTETINLLPYVTGTSKNVKFRFRAVAANGNNIYIDNFRFNATTPGEIEVTQSGNDVLDGGSYNYGSVSAGTPTTAVFTITNTGTSNLTLTGPITVTGTGFSLASTFGSTTVAAGGTTTFSVTFNSAVGGTFTGNVSFGTNDCDEGTYNFQLNAVATVTPPVADFIGAPTTVCAGSTVTFTDLSTNATSWSWNFGAGAVPATSTAQNPTVTFNTVGTNTITLTATNSFGSDVETKINYITVLSSTGVALPISEGFTAATFVPTGWTLVNTNASPTTWIRSATIGFAPTAGNSMMFDNFTYSDGDDDQVKLPGASFAGLVSAQLQFDVAYAPYDAVNYDGLEVLVSVDCGVTFTSVYSKSNTVLATAPAVTTAFTPTAAQWRTETIDLTPYIGNSKVIVSFKNLSGYGNRLFVDNINLTGVVGSTPPISSFTGAPTTICAGQSVTYTNTSTGSPTSYSWSFPGGTPSTSTATNPTIVYAAAGTYSVTLTATNGAGSDVSTLSNYITVNAAPATPGAITGTATICTSSTGNVYSISAVAGATSYTWSVPAGATITAGQGTTSATVTFGATSGNVTVTATNACGTSAASTLAITLTPIPATPGAITGTAAVCASSTGNVYSISAVAGATSYTWSVPAGATITAGQGTTSATVTFGATSGNVSVTATNACGTSAASTLAITLTSIPATPGAITGTAAVCASSTGNVYSISAVAGATSYTWSVPAGATITAGQGTTSATVTFGATSGNVSVTATNTCGTSAASTLAVTLTSIPATPGAITGTAAVCANSTGNIYSISAVAGATLYTWSVPAGATITAGQGTTSATVTFGATSGNVSVTATNTCGTSAASTLAITLSSIPATPGAITGTAAVCASSTGNVYSISAVAGATSYTWTVPAGATITAGQGTTSATVTFGATSGNVSVTATNTCGTSAASTLAITLTPIPATPGAITGTATICASSTGNVYSISAVAGATSYTWSVPAGATITAGQGTTSATVTFGATSGNVSVTATNTCGTSAASTLAITLTSIPATPGAITGTAAVCASSTGNVYSISAVAGATSYTWTVPAGATITAGQGTTSATVTFGTNSGNVSVTASNACGTSASSSSIAIIVNSTPTTPGAIAGSTTACQGSAGNIYSITPVAGATSYTWTIPGGGASITSGQGTASITVTFGNPSGNITVTASNACGTSTASVLAISLNNAAPATPGAITGSTTACIGSTNQSYSIAAVSGATNYTWTVPAGSTITSGQGTTSITMTAGATSGNITVTASSSCGTSAANTLAITMNPAPATPIVSVSDNCGSSILTSDATGSVLWSTSETTPSITVTTGGTYTVTQTIGGCTSTAGSGIAAPLAIPTTPIVSVGDNCGSSILTSDATGSVLWSTSETTPSITVTTGGTYTVTQTIGGCTSAAGSGIAAPVATPSTPIVTVSDNCGSSILTSDATGSVLWSTSETTPSITVTTGGTYTVTQTIGGCTSAAGSGIAAPLATPTTPTVTVSDNCGSSILTSDATGSVLWSTSETTPSITVTTGGTYTVTQTIGGCTSAAGSGIAAPLATPTTPTVTVSDNCGSSILTSDATGSVLWSTSETTPSITVTTGGTYTVTQTIGGCTSAAGSGIAAPVATPSTPIVTVSDICGSSILTSDATGSVLWSTSETTPSITVSTGGTYTVTQTIGGCTSAAGSGITAPVATPSTPIVTVSDNCGSSILTSDATGSVLWSTSETTPSITVTTGGTYTITQTIGGCTSAAGSGVAAPITSSPTPVVTVTNGCGSSTLTSNATGSVLWSSGETVPTIIVTAGGTYTVTQNIGGCVSAPGTGIAAPLSIPPTPVITVMDKCGMTDLTTSATGSLMWSTSETTPTITVTTSGTFFVSQTVGGCTSPVGTAVANPLVVPTVTFSPLADVCINAPAFAMTGGSPSGGTYSGTGVVANQFDPSVAGYGVFTITYVYADVNGCSASNQQPITVGCAEIEEEAISGISIYPNPTNGLFAIKANGTNVTFITIYDGAGKLVRSLDNKAQANEIQVDLMELAEGVYSLEIHTNESTYHNRIVLNK